MGDTREGDVARVYDAEFVGKIAAQADELAEKLIERNARIKTAFDVLEQADLTGPPDASDLSRVISEAREALDGNV